MLYRLLFWITIGVITPLTNGLPPDDPPRSIRGKTVLVLHSYYKGYRWTDEEGRGIDSVLIPELGASNVYIEYMDTKRFFGPRRPAAVS